MANLEFRNFQLTRTANTGDLLLLQTDPLGDKNYSGIKLGDFKNLGNFPNLYIGIGSPEGVVSAISGSLYTDGTIGQAVIYMKISGTGNIGWV
jgi:hypothetical protein